MCLSATCMWILTRSVEGVRCLAVELFGWWEPTQVHFDQLWTAPPPVFRALLGSGSLLVDCFEVPVWAGFVAWKHGDLDAVRSLWPEGHGNQLAVLPVPCCSFSSAFYEHPQEGLTMMGCMGNVPSSPVPEHLGLRRLWNLQEVALVGEVNHWYCVPQTVIPWSCPLSCSCLVSATRKVTNTSCTHGYAWDEVGTTVTNSPKTFSFLKLVFEIIM